MSLSFVWTRVAEQQQEASAAGDTGSLLSLIHFPQQILLQPQLVPSIVRPSFCPSCGEGMAKRRYQRFFPSRCPVAGCKYVAPNRRSREHHQNRHSGAKPHACTFADCDARFASSSSLGNHVCFVHLNTRKHKCHVCDKKFGTPTHLRRHISVHREHEPTACRHCQALVTVRAERTESVELAVQRRKASQAKKNRWRRSQDEVRLRQPGTRQTARKQQTVDYSAPGTSGSSPRHARDAESSSGEEDWQPGGGVRRSQRQCHRKVLVGEESTSESDEEDGTGSEYEPSTDEEEHEDPNEQEEEDEEEEEAGKDDDDDEGDTSSSASSSGVSSLQSGLEDPLVEAVLAFMCANAELMLQYLSSHP